MPTTPTSQELIDSEARWTTAIESAYRGEPQRLVRLYGASAPPANLAKEVEGAVADMALLRVPRGEPAWLVAIEIARCGERGPLVRLGFRELCPQKFRNDVALVLLNPVVRRRDRRRGLTDSQMATVSFMFAQLKVATEPGPSDQAVFRFLADRNDVSVNQIRDCVEKRKAYAKPLGRKRDISPKPDAPAPT